MHSTLIFAIWVAVASAAGLLAIFSSRLSELIRVPAPALFLLASAVASDYVPQLRALTIDNVQHVVTIALILILFDGGMHIGWKRFRSSAGPIIATGVVGTFLTAAAVALAARLLFGLSWPAALLLGTALSPTDPAVVFSVLGKREVAGRSGVIIEGESGANDPVGIALMASILLADTRYGSASSITSGIIEFGQQMLVGAGAGLVLGFVMVRLTQRVPLPSEALYSLRTLVSAGLVYGVATLAHGSGFLAVFVAGIIFGDIRAPYKAEIRRMHASAASLGEIVAFTVLGLTIDVHTVLRSDAWWIGLCLAALLAFAIRPSLLGPLLVPVRIARGEKILVAWAGLKGAVPILLGTFIFLVRADDAEFLYDIIFVVVLFSVVVQGGLVPWLAQRCRVPMQLVEPEPWSLGLRFREEPKGLRRYVVTPGSPADGRAISDLGLGEGVWVSVVSRRGNLLRITGSTILTAGDEVLALVDITNAPDPAPTFMNAT